MQALSGLHDQIPPFPRTLALKIIEEELGSPVDKVFSYISSEPVAAASFGQVTVYGCATRDFSGLGLLLFIFLFVMLLIHVFGSHYRFIEEEPMMVVM